MDSQIFKSAAMAATLPLFLFLIMDWMSLPFLYLPMPQDISSLFLILIWLLLAGIFFMGFFAVYSYRKNSIDLSLSKYLKSVMLASAIVSTIVSAVLVIQLIIEIFSKRMPYLTSIDPLMVLWLFVVFSVVFWWVCFIGSSIGAIAAFFILMDKEERHLISSKSALVGKLGLVVKRWSASGVLRSAVLAAVLTIILYVVASEFTKRILPEDSYLIVIPLILSSIGFLAVYFCRKSCGKPSLSKYLESIMLTSALTLTPMAADMLFISSTRYMPFPYTLVQLMGNWWILFIGSSIGAVLAFLILMDKEEKRHLIPLKRALASKIGRFIKPNINKILIFVPLTMLLFTTVIIPENNSYSRAAFFYALLLPFVMTFYATSFGTGNELFADLFVSLCLYLFSCAIVQIFPTKDRRLNPKLALIVCIVIIAGLAFYALYQGY